ncbi:MAG: hypothetical protein M3011_01995 [Actinomycetota bacterium]|nr:hypothetical protein [Actinomycetota bacterium]
MLRRALGGVAGALAAALGALILGEYPFSGLVVLGAGLLFGLFVAEAVVVVARWRGPGAATVSAVLAGAGLCWAAWISEGHQLGYLPVEGWAAIGLGVVVAGLRGWSPGPVADSPTGLAAPP